MGECPAILFVWQQQAIQVNVNLSVTSAKQLFIDQDPNYVVKFVCTDCTQKKPHLSHCWLPHSAFVVFSNYCSYLCAVYKLVC